MLLLLIISQKNSSQGVVEGMLGSENPNAQTQTPLEHIRGWLSGNPSHAGTGNAHEELLAGHNFKLPQGVEILKNDDGTFNIVRGNQMISDHIPLHYGANGELDAETLKRLGQDGVIAGATHNVVDATKEVTNDAQGWLNNHPGETTPIARDLWYGNDTPMTQDAAGNWHGADLNEIRTYWGGTNGSGLDTNGDYVLDVSHMTADGSFQNGLSVDAANEIKHDRLFAIISLTSGTQNNCIKVPIVDGQIKFDHTNPLYQQLFKPDASGHPVYHGKFLEVVQSAGVGKDGVEHVKPLGTLVGEGLDKIKETVPTHIDTVTETLNTPLGDEPQLFIPILSRKPLEKVVFKGPNPEKANLDQRKNISEDVAASKEEKKTSTNEIPPAGYMASESEPTSFEVDPLEYDDMRSDIEMINKKEQQSVGIIETEKTDFASDYGRSKYDELRTVVDEKPRTINKEELRKIGDGMEKILVNAKIAPLGIKEIRKHLPKLEERIKIAKKAKDTSLVKLLEGKIKQMKKIDSSYDKEMEKLRENLSKAEKAKNEEEVLKAEEEIRNFEKNTYTLKK
jgi:hypothetical protein